MSYCEIIIKSKRNNLVKVTFNRDMCYSYFSVNTVEYPTVQDVKEHISSDNDCCMSISLLFTDDMADNIAAQHVVVFTLCCIPLLERV